MSGANCVFVVDDDPSARSGLARLVRTAGYDSRDFASVNEFLDALSSDVSGCVVLDAGMPGLSVEKLQAELEARSLKLPIIVVTAYDDPGTKRKARKMEAVGFFGKPVDGTALLNAIDWALHSNRVDGNRENV
jgi:FixJ family two-component response regulator